MREELLLNRRHWDEATELHLRGNVYGVEDFLRGQCTLHRVEVEELASDVHRETSVLHLQCHFGLDSLSWARRGARVTGIDFSERAVESARRLSEQSGVPGRFVCCNLYDLPMTLEASAASLDVVFTSYGVLCWLPDLTRWAQIIAHFLKPGGIFYIVEAHPTARMFPMDQDIADLGAVPLRPCFSYFHESKGTYWPPSTDYAIPVMNKVGEHTWQHSISDIVNALIAAGLTIDWVHEFPFCAWAVIAGCEQIEQFGANHGYFGLKSAPSLPLMFSLRARRNR